MRSKKILPCLGGEVLLDVFGDFDVARELSVEAMMSIRSCSGAASLGGGRGQLVVLNIASSDERKGRSLGGMRSLAESVTSLYAMGSTLPDSSDCRTVSANYNTLVT
jgi:hypothetical protein